MKNTQKILLAFLAVALTMATLWFANGVVTHKETTWDDVLTEAKKGGYRLISTDDLWKRYSANPASLLLVDTRKVWEYHAGHIKGAFNFSMDPNKLIRWQKKKDMARFLGTDKERTIVFY